MPACRQAGGNLFESGILFEMGNLKRRKVLVIIQAPKNAAFPPLEHREQWAARKFKERGGVGKLNF
jgi:hypothetical protein